MGASLAVCDALKCPERGASRDANADHTAKEASYMKPVSGQRVRVHYKGTLADGSEFDSSAGRDPLEFIVGTGQVIPGFDAAVCDLETGECTTVTIVSDEAYGPRFDEAVQEVPREVFPDEPEVGWAVEMADPQGQRLAATIVDVAEDFVVLDFNHPLAGEDLTFEIELVEVLDAAHDESAEDASPAQESVDE
jgi:FKBP-type peptidyl-prolyl cis-trans isomerase 2